MYPMQNRESNKRHIVFQIAVILAIVFLLISCVSNSAPSVPVTAESIKTDLITETALMATLEPTQAVQRTPPALPALY